MIKNIKSWFLNNWILMLIFTLFFSLYAFSASSFNPGYADSDEMITIGYKLGVAHPSGYPWQILLTYIFTKIPIGTIAYRANLLSVFLHSLCLVLIVLIVKALYKRKINLWFVFFGICIFGLSGLFWLYSGINEVFALNDFLILLIIYFGIKWFDNFGTKIEKKYFIIVCILLGFGMTHLQTFILLYPAFGFLFLYKISKLKKWREYWKRFLFGLVIIVISFFIFNLVLFWLNSLSNDVSWYFEGLKGWWSHLRRSNYVFGKSTDQVSGFEAYVPKMNLKKVWLGFFGYWKFLILYLSLFGLGFGIFGLIYLWLKKRSIFWFLFLAFLFCGPVFSMLMGVEDPKTDAFFQAKYGLAHRQYLQSYVIWGIFIIFGCIWFFKILAKNIKNKINFVFLTGFLFLIIVGWMVWDNWQIGMSKNHKIVNSYARHVLDSVPEDSLIICTSDLPCLALIYVQEVEEWRKDVWVIPKNRFIKYNFVSKNVSDVSLLTPLEFEWSSEYTAHLIAWNLYKRRVFITDMLAEDINFLGINDMNLLMLPYGYLFEIRKDLPEELYDANYDLTMIFDEMNVSKKDFWMLGVRDFFDYIHRINARVYAYMGDEEMAKKNANLIKNKSFQVPEIYTNFDNWKKERYQSNVQGKSAEEILELSRLSFENSNIGDGLKYLRYSSYLDNENIKIKFRLADVFEKIELKYKAQLEYRKILMIEPGNEEAKLRMSLLESI
jgi:transmembrane protein TMEM260 (protein O-mannosyltransferase)